MNTLIESVHDFLKTHQLLQRPLVIAYSGGRDSHVLLHVIAQLRLQYPSLICSAHHVHHGLQAVNDEWLMHCSRICQALQIPLKISHLALHIPAGESMEATARHARYHALNEKMSTDEVILTAHSLDDQAETFFLQLMRGSGPKGLAGISVIKPFGKGLLARPLLGISREQIAEYAAQNQLAHIEDPSNANERFKRNQCRHTIFPFLENYYPALKTCLARTAEHSAQTERVLQAYLADDFAVIKGREIHQLRLDQLATFEWDKQVMLFRYWLGQNGVKNPSTVKCQTLLKQMLQADHDRQPCVEWDEVEVRRQGRVLFLLDPARLRLSGFVGQALWSNLSQPLALPNGQRLQAKLVKGTGIAQHKIPQGLAIRFRQGGERCRIPKREGSRSLKKLFQERQIPEWERASVPLLYADDEIAQVADWFVCAGWEVENPDEMGWEIMIL